MITAARLWRSASFPPMCTRQFQKQREHFHSSLVNVVWSRAGNCLSCQRDTPASAGCARRSSLRGVGLLSDLFASFKWEKWREEKGRRASSNGARAATRASSSASVQMWICFGLVAFSLTFSISMIHCSFKAEQEDCTVFYFFYSGSAGSTHIEVKVETTLFELRNACLCQHVASILTKGDLFSFVYDGVHQNAY